MKLITILIGFGVLISCNEKFKTGKVNTNVVSLINHEHNKKMGIKKGSPFKHNDRRIYEVRNEAVELFRVEVDTNKLTKFIVWDIISFGGGGIDGKIIINDSLYYNYTASNKLRDDVKRSGKQILPGVTDSVIDLYLKLRKFKELETLAREKSKHISGSDFLYIGMYERGMDSIYVNKLPIFIVN